MSPGASLRPTRIRPKAATSSRSCSSRAGMAIVQPDRGRASGRVYTRPFRSRPVLDFRCVPLPYPHRPSRDEASTRCRDDRDRQALLTYARWSTLICCITSLTSALLLHALALMNEELLDRSFNLIVLAL